MKTVPAMAVRVATCRSASLSCCRQRIRCTAVGLIRSTMATAAQTRAEKYTYSWLRLSSSKRFWNGRTRRKAKSTWMPGIASRCSSTSSPHSWSRSCPGASSLRGPSSATGGNSPSVSSPKPSRAADELAADVEPEPGAAHASRHVGVEAVELLEDPLVVVGRDGEALVPHREGDDAFVGVEPHLDPASVRGVLDRVLEEVDENLPRPVAIGAHEGYDRGADEVDGDSGRRVHPHRVDDTLHEVGGVERLAGDVEAVPVQLGRPPGLADEPAEALRLVHDEREEAVASRLVEDEVVPAQGLSGSVHGRERRAQLVGGGGDELGLELVEPPLLGDVAEGVDGPAEELDARDRDPALALPGFDRHGLRGPGLPRGDDGDALGEPLPAGHRFGRGMADHGRGGGSGDHLPGRIPEPDDAATIEEEDAVAHVREHSGRVGPLLYLAVEPCVVDGQRRAPGEILRQRELVDTVEAAGPARHEGDGAQSAPAREEGDAQPRFGVELAERGRLGAVAAGREPGPPGPDDVCDGG